MCLGNGFGNQFIYICISFTFNALFIVLVWLQYIFLCYYFKMQIKHEGHIFFFNTTLQSAVGLMQMIFSTFATFQIKEDDFRHLAVLQGKRLLIQS